MGLVDSASPTTPKMGRGNTDGDGFAGAPGGI
jgi:hypothetical protein